MFGRNLRKAFIISKNNSIFYRRQGFWGYSTLFFSLLVYIPIILTGLVMISEMDEIKDVSMGIVLVILVIFGFKFVIQGMGQANELNISIKTLVPFPISTKVKFLYLFSLRSFSISSIFFITFFAIVTYGILRKDLFAGIYAGILFFLFIVMTDIWMTDLIMYFNKALKKYKFVPILLMTIFLLPVWLSSSKIITANQLFHNLNRVPVLNWPGNGVYAALTGQWLNAGLNLLYIIAFSAAGYLLGVFIIKKKHFN